MRCAMSPASSGSQYSPASPSTSGSDELLAAMVGTPHASASSTGSPNPS